VIEGLQFAELHRFGQFECLFLLSASDQIASIAVSLFREPVLGRDLAFRFLAILHFGNIRHFRHFALFSGRAGLIAGVVEDKSFPPFPS
jgi:hypothetical protein